MGVHEQDSLSVRRVFLQDLPDTSYNLCKDLVIYPRRLAPPNFSRLFILDDALAIVLAVNRGALFRVEDGGGSARALDRTSPA